MTHDHRLSEERNRVSGTTRPVNIGPAAPGTQRFLPRAFRLVARALALHCPNCGAGGIFTTWLRLRPACPACALDFERREQGYIVGAYMLNIVAAELLWVAGFLIVLAGTWPDPPWGPLRWGGAVLVLVLPVLTYPFSKTLFLAMDLAFRPAGRE